jgi:hypothetical protein
VHLYNDSSWWWTFDNLDNVGLVATSVAPPPIPADFDGDYDVDGADYIIFESCVTGPGVETVSPECEPVDLDFDYDVDQADFGLFQRCLSGSGVAGDPVCAE